MNRSFDFSRLTIDYHIPTASPGDKHNRRGWVNVACPFCIGSAGHHLGFNQAKSYFTCHRCGGHNAVETIRRLLNIDWETAKALFTRYGGRAYYAPEEEEARERPSAVKLPVGTSEVTPRHARYLAGRGFTPHVCVEEWGLLGTGLIGAYKLRIIAPVLYRGNLVSYQGRDITGKAPLKYKACPEPEEVIPHKHLLYGADKVPGHSVVVVEGVTDVWKLGPGAVATFGIEWTPEQVARLKQFSRRFILFDSEPQAQRQARELAGALGAYRGETSLVSLPELKEGEDVGDIPEEKAREIIRDLRVY
jgi:hypothetical protein